MKRYLTKRYIIIALIILGALGVEAYEWHAISKLSFSQPTDQELINNIQTITYQYDLLVNTNKKLEARYTENEKSIKALQTELTETKSQLDAAQQNQIALLIDKLKDKSYTSTYNEGYTWYTAAEALGSIGKPAIPYLIKKIDTKDKYERSLVLYSLLLASQADNVKEFAGSDYIKIKDSFDSKAQEDMKKEVLRWWEKYKDKF